MRHGSLFSGIGGFDLAAEWMGWENIFHCEWNPFGQKVLKHHFPNSISYNDITKTDFSIHRGDIDILTGGFPCQPYSTAGLRKGKADERHLFPEMLRAIKEIEPTWIIGENVRGLVSWNEGMVFHEVCDDLEREGYEVQSFLIPAAGVNAPHQRQRIWFVAYCKDFGCKPTKTPNEWEEHIQNDRNGIRTIFESNGEIRNVTDTNSVRLEHSEEGRNIFKSSSETQSKGGKSSQSIKADGEIGDASNTLHEGLQGGQNADKWKELNTIWRGNGVDIGAVSKDNKWDSNINFSEFPTQSPICGGNDGIPRELDSITFSKWRNESIKAYGNAIVPQVAYEIFKAIQSFEDLVKV